MDKSEVKLTSLLLVLLHYVLLNKTCQTVSMLYVRGLPHGCGGFF